MKKLTYLISFVMLLTLFSGCEDFLERDPEDKISNDNLLSDLEGVTYALVGCYNDLCDGYYYRTNWQVINELRGGNVKVKASLTSGYIERFIPFYGFGLESDDHEVENIYEHLYQVLAEANNILEVLDEIPDATEAQRDHIRGELLTIRAMVHFDLLRMFTYPYDYQANAQHHGIVVNTSTPDVLSKPSRSSVYESYKQIVTDLEEAIGLLNDDEKHGPTRKMWIGPDVAKALMARVCLYKQDWNGAIEYSTHLIEDATYGLVPGDMLASGYESGSPTQETIWILDNSQDVSESLSKFMGVPDIADKTELAATGDLLSLYSENDYRRDLLVEFSGDTVSLKYRSSGNIESDIELFRLAEMYLIRAEAYARIGKEVQARADLQTIRQRANPAAAQPSFSGEELIQEILTEKRRELAFEGHLFYDLKRTGSDIVREDCNATENHNVTYPSFRYVFPIPYDELMANDNMEQTEGYN